jgi:hypothetical protein
MEPEFLSNLKVRPELPSYFAVLLAPEYDFVKRCKTSVRPGVIVGLGPRRSGSM